MTAEHRHQRSIRSTSARRRRRCCKHADTAMYQRQGAGRQHLPRSSPPS
ncbi:MAG: hypothetical protein MZV65_54365 [Chromatiales bacterium]|nr:hypothetical protein [Chromatiales bacterium]